MSGVMDAQWSELAANGICHAAQMASQEAQFAFGQMTRPSIQFRPTLSADGDMWCALLGDDLQVGVSGFGETPAAAMEAFDKAFLSQRTPTAVRLAKARNEEVAR